MEVRSLRIPYALAGFIAPAAVAIAVPVCIMVLAAAANDRIDLLRVLTVTAAIFAIYAGGAIMWLILRLRVGRETSRALAIATLLASLALIMFSFGHRTSGEFLFVASVGGVVMSAPRDAWSARIVLRDPTRGTIWYWVITLELPALVLLMFAARDYLSGNNTAAADFGTAWFVYLTYLFGFVGWSLIRAHSPVSAFFSASVVIILGYPIGMLLASFGPVSLIAPVAGFGGIAACIPHLWDRSRDGDTADIGIRV